MKAGQRQTLIDVAVECGGHAEAVWEIAVRNGIGLTDAVAGMQLDVPSVPADQDTVSAMVAADAHPACEGAVVWDVRVPIGQAVIGTDMVN